MEVANLKEQGWPLKEALAAVGLSKSTYFYRSQGSRPKKPLDPELCEAIRKILKVSPVYGYRKLYRALRAQGWKVNHKKVLRHLRRMGLLQPRKLKGPRATQSKGTIYPLSSNTYWEMDLTYVWSGYSGQGYLFAVIDAFDKGIPGSRFDNRCRAVEASQALEEAVLIRFGGRVPKGHHLTLRVDRGSQFIACRFKEAARALNVQLEYAGIHCPDDKPYIESFFGKYKTEEVYRNQYTNLIEAKSAWKSYRLWYEEKRLHQALGYQTPKEFLSAAVGLKAHQPLAESQRVHQDDLRQVYNLSEVYSSPK